MWRFRSNELEIIDLGPDHYTSDEYKTCLKKLFLINRLLGFVSNIRQFLKFVSPTSTILDVGCGGGLLLIHLKKYFPTMKLIGIDTSAQGILEANSNLVNSSLESPTGITFNQVTMEWKIPAESVDIVTAVLVCHHISDSELCDFFRAMLDSAKTAVIIHDLHRNRISYALYYLISFFFRNRLIRHDGLLSIKRGFTFKELSAHLKNAGIKKYDISWRFPFCWRIILWKK